MTKELTPEQAAILAAHPNAIAWHGGNCPVDPVSKPTVFTSLGYPHGEDYAWAAEWSWLSGHENSKFGHGYDILAYIPDPAYPTQSFHVPTDLISRQSAIEDVQRVYPNRYAVAAINAIEPSPRPTRQNARKMLADVLRNNVAYNLKKDSPAVKAILDAIAGEE